MEFLKLKHIYQRGGFGLPMTKRKFTSQMFEQEVNTLFKTSESTEPLKVPIAEINSLLEDRSVGTPREKRMMLNKLSRTKLLRFNVEWLNRMASTEAQLAERMTLFWSGHFVAKSNNIIYAQSYNNTLRKHALGNFRNLVLAISKEAAILDYLNNQQNKASSPNENFARELMELFTLGEGHYTEKEIKEAARSFTGWGHDLEGNFRFREKRHDFGRKTFFGKTGNFNGEDIIDIILEQKQCALFISKKIYTYFVNQQVNEDHIAEMAEVFYKNYDIKAVLRHMFLADWFYDDGVMGNKIKSPTDFLVGMMRVVPYNFQKPKDLLYVQRLLGQELLNPPNVAGWPEGKKWIDTNTMMVRLKLPSVLLGSGSIAFDIKGEFEDSFNQFNRKRNTGKKLNIDKDWEAFKKNCYDLTDDELQLYLLGNVSRKETRSFLKSLKKESKSNYCIQLMSLPEYQLC